MLTAKPINLLFICLFVGSLLLTACGEYSLDVNFGNSGEQDPGVSQTSLFILLAVILFVMFALVLVSVASR